MLRVSRQAQPAPGTVPVGSLCFVTDESRTERSSGTVWEILTEGFHHQATRRLDNTEIRLLPTVPVMVVPAPPAGFLHLVRGGFVVVNYQVAYNGTKDATWQLFYTKVPLSIASGMIDFADPPVVPPRLRYGTLPPLSGPEVLKGYGPTGWKGDISALDGSPIGLADRAHQIPNYTGGGPANWAQVTVQYVTLNWQAGLLV